MKQSRASPNQKVLDNLKSDETESPSADNANSLDIIKQETSERPKRKAKTKEAMQRYLNRDVQFLQEKPEKKKNQQNQSTMLAHTTPNQGKTSVNTLQNQSIKGSVTKSLDVQAPTRPVGPFASSLKGTEKDMMQKSTTVGGALDGGTQRGDSSPDMTENNGGKSTLGKSDRLAVTVASKGSKKKPVTDTKKGKTSGGKGAKIEQAVASNPAPSKTAANQGKKIESTANVKNINENADIKQQQKAVSVNNNGASSIEKVSKGVKKPKESLDNNVAKHGPDVKPSNVQNKKSNAKESQLSTQKQAKAIDEELPKSKSKKQLPQKEPQDQSGKKDTTDGHQKKPQKIQNETETEEEEEEFDEDMDEELEQEYDDEEMEEDPNDDEELEDEEEEDEMQSQDSVSNPKAKSKRKFYLDEKRIANRALRIKMGKSGAQAATRKNIKKGKDACQRKLWNQGEDDAIVDLVAKYGTKRWTFIAQQLTDEYLIGGRTGKQCRERWHNHLDPSIKKSPINNEEERIIFDAHKVYGNKWADIAKLLHGRSDNCIKNYYYSTLRKHIRRINKSLKQCQVAKKLNLKVKCLTADILFPLVKEQKITYSQVKNIDPKKFEDLEHTMRMIFNHEDGQQVTQRGIIAAAQNRLKVEQKLEEMRQNELAEQKLLLKKRNKKLADKQKQSQRDEKELDSRDEEMSEDEQQYEKNRSPSKLIQKNKNQAAHNGKRKSQETEINIKEQPSKRLKTEGNSKSSDSDSQFLENSDSEELQMDINSKITKKQSKNQQKHAGQYQKVTKSDDNLPNQRNKQALDSDEESVAQKNRNRNSMKKNSALLDDQFKNFNKQKANNEKSTNDQNPYLMDSQQTNSHQINFSAKFGQSKDLARLTGEQQKVRNNSSDNQSQLKLSSVKHKTVTGNLMKPTSQFGSQNLANRQVPHASNISFGQQYQSFGGINNLVVPKLAHGQYYSSYMPTLPIQSFYKGLPGELYMSQYQKMRRREVTDNTAETEGNNGNVTNSKIVPGSTGVNLFDSAMSQRDKKDKKKKKKKDKKKSRKERDEKHRSKSRTSYPFMPQNFIHPFGPYGQGFHGNNGSLQDVNYQAQANDTADMLHLHQQKNNQQRIYPMSHFHQDSRDIKKGKEGVSSGVPFVYGPAAGHQPHLPHLHPQTQGQGTIGETQGSTYHNFEHIHGMPHMYYPYPNPYFMSQGNPPHSMTGVYTNPHSALGQTEITSQNDQSKSAKKTRQRSTDSQKMTKEQKENLPNNQKQTNNQEMTQLEKEVGEDPEKKGQQKEDKNEKSAANFDERSESKSKISSKSKHDKSNKQATKDKKIAHQSLVPPEALGYCPTPGGLSHIPIQAFYQIGQTGKLQIPQHLGIPLAHTHHHPAMAYHQQQYYHQYGHVPPMNSIYNQLGTHNSKNDLEGYQGTSSKQAKGANDNKKKEATPGGAGSAPGQQGGSQIALYNKNAFNHNQFDMPPTPNNVKMQTLQKEITGLNFAGQTPRAGQINVDAGMHTPKSHTPRGGISRRPRKFSNASQQNENGANCEDSSIAKHNNENTKKPQSCFENSQQQQPPSAQYNNNIMFIRYGPLFGRKRDKSQQHATDVKMFEQNNEQERDGKAAEANDLNATNADQNETNKKSLIKDSDQKHPKETTIDQQKMVMNPQFIKNLGEHLAQEFFNIKQDYSRNSQLEMSESEFSEKQQPALVNQQNSNSANLLLNTTQNESNSKLNELRTSERKQSSLSLQAKKQADSKTNKAQEILSPRKHGSHQKNNDHIGGSQATLLNNSQTTKNAPFASFKLMKPRMGLQKDFNNTNVNVINSKGVTPGGGQGLTTMYPLPSTSHFLMNFGQQNQNQQSMKGFPAGSQQTIKSFKGNDIQNSLQASLGLARFKLLQMTPKLNYKITGTQSKQSATPVGGTSQKQRVQLALNEFLKKEHNTSFEQGQPHRPPSTKNFMNSGHTFNENSKLGSMLNTKTNAQLANGVNGQKIVTPKATMANDPEARNKLLGKLLQSATHQIDNTLNQSQLPNQANTEQKVKPDPNFHKDCHIKLGGAFTKKLMKILSQKELSNNQQNEERLSMKKNNQEEMEVNNSNNNGNQCIVVSKDFEKDSLGLLQANQQAISQTLDLNQEPLSSLYTGAPAFLECPSRPKQQQTQILLAGNKSLFSDIQQHSTSIQQIQTPLLGIKMADNEDAEADCGENGGDPPATQEFQLEPTKPTDTKMAASMKVSNEFKTPGKKQPAKDKDKDSILDQTPDHEREGSERHGRVLSQQSQLLEVCPGAAAVTLAAGQQDQEMRVENREEETADQQHKRPAAEGTANGQSVCQEKEIVQQRTVDVEVQDVDEHMDT